MSINFDYFPHYEMIPNHLRELVNIFKKNKNSFSSENYQLESNEVLRILTEDLKKLDFEVESGKSSSKKIKIPVLFGKNGKIDKSFEVDAFKKKTKTILEVEAGRACANNQFLKDIFQACVIVDVEYLVVAVRNIYRKSNDFEKIRLFLETLYSSKKFLIPLKGILLIGY
jgi:hypothetical protein